MNQNIGELLAKCDEQMISFGFLGLTQDGEAFCTSKDLLLALSHLAAKSRKLSPGEVLQISKNIEAMHVRQRVPRKRRAASTSAAKKAVVHEKPEKV